MERFVAQENLRRLRRQLEGCSDETQKALLEELLVEAEAKLKSLGLPTSV